MLKLEVDTEAPPDYNSVMANLEQLRELKETDLPLAMAAVLKLADKSRNLVPFYLNPVQRRLDSQMTSRNIRLKARQLGSSIFDMGASFLEVITVPNTVMVVISDEHFATRRLLTRVHTFYENLPLWFKPEIHHYSSNEMTFPWQNSSIYIGTAGQRAFTRGDTVHRALVSEMAQYTDAQVGMIMPGLESVPLHKSVISIESTANGEGNAFHLRCMEARKGEGVYAYQFLPWFLGEDYCIPPGSIAALEEDRGCLSAYDRAEQKVIELMRAALPDLTEEQVEQKIRWRRLKLAELKGLFYQEYPEDDLTCFLTSAMAAFDSTMLTELSLGSFEAPVVTPYGARVWVRSHPTHRYIIGCDPSGGVKDRSVAVVLDISSPQQVAHVASLAGVWEPDYFARQIVSLAADYHLPLLVVEDNEYGHAVLNALIFQFKYPRLYHRRDLLTGKEGKPGWHTTAPTKRAAFTELKSMLESRAFVTWDSEALRELRSFRKNASGALEAGPSAHDDYVVALMVGVAARLDAPVYSPAKAEPYGWSKRERR